MPRWLGRIAGPPPNSSNSAGYFLNILLIIRPTCVGKEVAALRTTSSGRAALPAKPHLIPEHALANLPVSGKHPYCFPRRNSNYLYLLPRVSCIPNWTLRNSSSLWFLSKLETSSSSLHLIAQKILQLDGPSTTYCFRELTSWTSREIVGQYRRWSVFRQILTPNPEALSLRIGEVSHSLAFSIRNSA